MYGLAMMLSISTWTTTIKVHSSCTQCLHDLHFMKKESYLTNLSKLAFCDRISPNLMPNSFSTNNVKSATKRFKSKQCAGRAQSLRTTPFRLVLSCNFLPTLLQTEASCFYSKSSERENNGSNFTV